MTAYDAFLARYERPPGEFAPAPFWFLNDAPTAQEIGRQLQAFHDKGIRCVVLHPRIGLPEEMAYLSDSFFDMIGMAVENAAALGMRVILYDEGMYPSGSASGLVVAENGRYAARCVTPLYGDAPVPESAEVVADYAYPLYADGSIDLNGAVPYGAQATADMRRVRVLHRPSGGTIRGIHYGEDDGEPGAPAAADILSLEAVDCFLRLTHEQYRARFGRYFGGVIWGIFTDEPSALGRGHVADARPWTWGFETALTDAGVMPHHLAALWLDAGPDTDGVRARYEAAVYRRLGEAYYGRLSAWCRAHGLALMGHPAESDEVSGLACFDVPGQDVVFRYVALEKDNLHSRHGVMAKVAADAARLDGKERNLNEALGCCFRGKVSWDLPFADAKWIMDHLLSRGCNLLIPHAFYYSLRGRRKEERPPDVGMNSPWWDAYDQIVRYIGRLSWLNIGRLDAPVAVVCRDRAVPADLVAPLYERQIGFVYVEEERLTSASAADAQGCFALDGYRFAHLLADASAALSDATARALADKGIEPLRMDEAACAAWADGHPLLSALAVPRAGVRCQRMTLDGVAYLTAFNEAGEAADITPRDEGYDQVWLPFEEARYALDGAFRLLTGQTAVFVRTEAEAGQPVWQNDPPWTAVPLIDWTINGQPASQAQALDHRMTDAADTEAVYGASFALPASFGRVAVRFAAMRESAYLTLGGAPAGACLISPGVVDITRAAQSGENRLEIRVLATWANRFDGARIPCGLLGPVEILMAP